MSEIKSWQCVHLVDILQITELLTIFPFSYFITRLNVPLTFLNIFKDLSIWKYQRIFTMLSDYTVGSKSYQILFFYIAVSKIYLLFKLTVHYKPQQTQSASNLLCTSYTHERNIDTVYFKTELEMFALTCPWVDSVHFKWWEYKLWKRCQYYKTRYSRSS